MTDTQTLANALSAVPLTLVTDSEPMAPEEIIRRIGSPVRQLPGGKVGCPVCSEAFTHPAAIGPHLRLHWTAAGVPIRQRPHGRDKVACPECTSRVNRSSLAQHLMMRHDTPQMEANGMARVYGFTLHPPKPETPAKRKSGRPPKDKSLALVKPEPKPKPTPTPTPGPDWTTIDPSEIAVGVVLSQANGSMPTALLPDVIAYVDHTRDLIGKLRATQ